jgi:pyridoxamine 5'-phosphate oxidase
MPLKIMGSSDNNYISEELNERSADLDPIRLFERWFQDASREGLPLPDAVTLATASRDGRPSARMILLKQIDKRGLVFFTNYRSAKAKELEANPFAALVAYWPQLERQVRIEGAVERISAEESDQYFQTRPRDSQIGAIASPQSDVIESRKVLETRFAELEEIYRGQVVERPPHWGGYRLTPCRIEFWKGRPGRLHDRLLYEIQKEGTWTVRRLAP